MITKKNKLRLRPITKISIKRRNRHANTQTPKYNRLNTITAQGNARAADGGWIRITIRGAPYERGVSHGKQILAADPANTVFVISGTVRVQ